MPGCYRVEGVFMQRVIGVGGDRVACCTTVGSEERVTVNGEPVSEPYVYEGDADGVHRPYAVKVPQGRLFLMVTTGPTRWTPASSPPITAGPCRWTPCGDG
ncbi:S26 family signal peptidase [Streptomyces olivaceoviridis]|uniref:S26 family signal peptidase n=1 Tax=Streptomyces olivaceoviridis TaxID=1921 RepID=UPI00370075E6